MSGGVTARRQLNTWANQTEGAGFRRTNLGVQGIGVGLPEE
jgi:hypothetical protein